MLHNPIPATAAGDAEDALDYALLDLLIDVHPGLWSLHELTRSLTSSAQTTASGEPPVHETEDAIERLYAAGLIHRVGNYVFATRAAHTAQRLAS
jgi:HD-like signal output (HDOD) protein